MQKTIFTCENDSFREQLKELRIGIGKTQAELAGLLGQPQSYVSKYETGERRLDFVETYQVCKVLGVGFESFAAEFARRAVTNLKRSRNRKSLDGHRE